MNVQTHWRIALMFDAPGGDLAALEEGLKRAGESIRAAAGGNPVRLGVADRHSDLGGPVDTHDMTGWRTVDGAVEITLANEKVVDTPAVCRSLRPLLAGLVDLSSVEVMTGPMFPMVPVRRGGTFLSLAFRRDPGTTSRQFRDWWLHQHAGVASPVLGPELLAYDQVHVNLAASAAAAAGFGVSAVEYDAYDNLTWADRHAYLHSTRSDPDGMARVAEDEAGRIDNTSRRFSIMVEVR